MKLVLQRPLGPRSGSWNKMTFSEAWMQLRNLKMAKTKLMDIKVQRQQGPTMVTESELGEKSQVNSFQVQEVRQPFKAAKLKVKPARNPVRTKFSKASETVEYPWNKTPIMVSHLYAKNNYVFPRKTKKVAAKEQPNKTKELVCRCPALSLQKPIPRKTKTTGTSVISLKAKTA